MVKIIMLESQIHYLLKLENSMEILNFVTLFNSNYLSRGLTMYQSLEKHCTNFHLYVVAFDDITFNYLTKFPQSNLTVISLSEFEDEKLLAIKSTRSAGEYCWTCTASTIIYAINTFDLDHCVYIDADMCFFSNPQILFDEWGTNSVLITEHRYTEAYDQSKESGVYCVQFVGFKNDTDGLLALNYWREACIDWCYARVENGKFGDQKYLDDWTTRFNNVHVLQHLGGGLAPWNMQQYEFNIVETKLIGTEISTSKKFEAVFFHFHSLKFFENDIVIVCSELYDLNKNTLELIFKPYVKLLHQSKLNVLKNDSSFNSQGSAGKCDFYPLSFKVIKSRYLADLKSSRINLLGFNLLKYVCSPYYFNSSKI